MAKRSEAGHGPGAVLVFTKGSARGGVERIAERLMRGWREEGVAVAHATTRFGRPVPEWLEMAALLWATWRVARRERPALLFCPGNAYAVVAVLMKLAMGRRCPPIVAKISNDLRRPDMPWLLRAPYRAWLRLQGRLIDAFAALSSAMADEVVACLRVPRRAVHVVPNPVLSRAEIERDAARVLPDPAPGRRFVAVGRLEPQKNLPLLLRAFATGGGAADTLTVVGEGRERAALERLARTLGVAGRVRFAGWCGAVRDELARHDVLLLSSDYEGQPGAVVEALAVGLDVVATRCCAGMDDLLDHGALGRLVAPGDLPGFAAAIADARAGAQDRARAGAKAAASTIEAALPAYRALFAAASARGRQGLPAFPAEAMPA